MATSNTVLVSAYFKNLPADDSKYSRLIQNMKNVAWSMKQNIIAGNTSHSLDYYKFHHTLVDVLENKQTVYSQEMKPADINFSMYEQFSKAYDLDIDVEVSKTGIYIEEVLDNTSVGYYNNLCTVIQNGCIEGQYFSHVDSAGNKLEQPIHFDKDDCKSKFSDLYGVLRMKISDIIATAPVRDLELPDIDYELTKSMDRSL